MRFFRIKSINLYNDTEKKKKKVTSTSCKAHYCIYDICLEMFQNNFWVRSGNVVGGVAISLSTEFFVGDEHQHTESDLETRRYITERPCETMN